jgi:hypothetical protein
LKNVNIKLCLRRAALVLAQNPAAFYLSRALGAAEHNCIIGFPVLSNKKFKAVRRIFF